MTLFTTISKRKVIAFTIFVKYECIILITNFWFCKDTSYLQYVDFDFSLSLNVLN